MKTTAHLLVALALLAQLPSLKAETQDSPPAKHRDLTMWIDAKLGSHIGGGYASTYVTNIRPKTIGNDDPGLQTAIKSLDGLGMLRVKGFGLVPAAVAWQTETPTH